jgi:hypothetical protein
MVRVGSTGTRVGTYGTLRISFSDLATLSSGLLAVYLPYLLVLVLLG